MPAAEQDPATTAASITHRGHAVPIHAARARHPTHQGALGSNAEPSVLTGGGCACSQEDVPPPAPQPPGPPRFPLLSRKSDSRKLPASALDCEARVSLSWKEGPRGAPAGSGARPSALLCWVGRARAPGEQLLPPARPAAGAAGPGVPLHSSPLSRRHLT
ncbi:WAS/WASL-interacting protein family member 1-like isoform X1 [Canis lupus familiaris]|uniref:WAS/WASL-interacting protein family member 1-like isoform X1 n=1 Tax=Canis lupus familiaris TaxID=9615 RepID=UPI0018F3B2BB|nr:WAS/WASL-interacting protein family member 1-like isoform X1 [Canis lupus familiaris]